MIRSIILWFARRLLAKYVSTALAGRIVEAASEAFDEIKARGPAGEVSGVRVELPRPSPHDPGAKPVSLDDILRSENQPNV